MELNRIKERVKELIAQGERVLGTAHKANYGTYVDQAAFHEWSAASRSFLHQVFGRDHHFSQWHADKCSFEDADDARRGIAILKAAAQEIEGGYLRRIEALVSADVFTDFLEMADHLLASGYKDPAAVLGGAVLEDGLRRIARRNGVEVSARDDLASLNQKLAQAGVYNRLEQRRIHAWTELRNKAAHGQFGEYDQATVAEMLQGVADTLAKQS